MEVNLDIIWVDIWFYSFAIGMFFAIGRKKKIINNKGHYA